MGKGQLHSILPLVKWRFQNIEKCYLPSLLPPLLSHKSSACTSVLINIESLHRSLWRGCFLPEKPEIHRRFNPRTRRFRKAPSSSRRAMSTFNSLQSGLGSLPCYARCASTRRSALISCPHVHTWSRYCVWLFSCFQLVCLFAGVVFDVWGC